MFYRLVLFLWNIYQGSFKMEILVDVDSDPDLWNSVCWFAIICFKSLFLHSGLLLNIYTLRFFSFFSEDDALNRFCESYLHTCHADDGQNKLNNKMKENAV